jgi:ankyrin repeat protein
MISARSTKSIAIAAVALAVSGLIAVGCKKKPTLPYGRDMQTAIEDGNVATVKMLLDAGVDPNGKDAYGHTPLMDAADASVLKDDGEVIKMLVSAGADPDGESVGHRYPIEQAALAGSPTPVEILVKAGANVNRITPEGGTPLINALGRGQAETAKFLINHGADVNAGGERPGDERSLRDHTRSSLFYASGYLNGGDVPVVVQMILDHGGTVPKDECGLVIPELRKLKFERQADELASRDPCK